MFVIVLHYVQPMKFVNAHLEAHRAYLDQHYAAGHFIASGPKEPRTGGVILAHTMGRPQLDAMLAEDPFYEHQIAQYEVIEFHPNKFAAGAEAILQYELTAK